jgi:hypothetical protein
MKIIQKIKNFFGWFRNCKRDFNFRNETRKRFYKSIIRHIRKILRDGKKFKIGESKNKGSNTRGTHLWNASDTSHNFAPYISTSIFASEDDIVEISKKEENRLKEQLKIYKEEMDLIENQPYYKYLFNRMIKKIN